MSSGGTRAVEEMSENLFLFYWQIKVPIFYVEIFTEKSREQKFTKRSENACSEIHFVKVANTKDRPIFKIY